MQAPTTTGTSEDESSYSSFYSSFLKTDEGPTSSNEGRLESHEMEKVANWNLAPKTVLRRPNPQWLDNVDVTNEFVYRYQVSAKTLADVLKTDLCALKHIHQGKIQKIPFVNFYNSCGFQPDLINDQLDQLYLDLEDLHSLQGLSGKFSLESSGSSGEEDFSLKPMKRKIQYSKLVLIYEENCPFP